MWNILAVLINLKNHNINKKALAYMMLATVVSIIGGGCIFAWLEKDVGLFDGIYWAAVTFFTVGYGDILPKTQAAKIFMMFYAFEGQLVWLTFTAFGLGAILAVIEGGLKGKHQVHGQKLILVVDPVDEHHFRALLEGMRAKGMWNKVVLISNRFEELPSLTKHLGKVAFIRGDPLDIATYRQASFKNALAVVACAPGLNDPNNDIRTAAVVRLIESSNASIVTVAEILVEDNKQLVQRQNWQADSIVLVDRAICRQLASRIVSLANGRLVAIKFKAFDDLKAKEFERCLTNLSVQFQQVEDNPDIEVVFASDLDDPEKSDALASTQAEESKARHVLVEYLSVRHTELFQGHQAICLDQAVAEEVAAQLANRF